LVTGATNTGTNLANTYGNIGTSQAQGILGGTNALASGVSGAAGGAANALMLNQLMTKLSGQPAMSMYSTPTGLGSTLPTS
jgi:hypothetical protein